MTTRILWLCLALTASPASVQAAEMRRDNDTADATQVFVQTGNKLHVTVARFSPDGRWLAVCDALGTVVLWDAHGGRQYREVHRHTGLCTGLAFTPDGRAVISSGGPRSGNEVTLTRWLDGQVEQTWLGHQGHVRDIVATLDAQGAWSLGEHDGLMRWAVGKDAPLQRIAVALPGEAADKQADASTMVLSRDQKRAFVGRRDGSLLLIDLTPERPAVRLLAQFPEAISALALAPDETTLAVANGTMMGATQRDVTLLDATTGKTLRTLPGHLGPVFALAYSPDSRFLGSAGQVDMQALLAGDLKGIRQHETIRVWRVADGGLVAEARNQRNLNGMPFVRGGIEFAPASATPETPRLGLAMWDEAARLYELDAAGTLRLAHTLEGRGLSPRQLQASDASARLLVTDGRPRVAPPEAYMNAEVVRREFGRAEDWTPDRLNRLNALYAGRGMLTSVQRAALWDLKTGRLDKVIDWQRAPVGYLGLDGQGRFVSMASLFPTTTMVSPLKTNLVREATVDAEGQISLSHFAFEPWLGKPDEIFAALPPAVGSVTDTANPGNAAKPDAAAEAGYYAEIVSQSASGRWQAVAGIPLTKTVKAGDGTPIANPGRLFVQERLPDGRREHRHDIALPGIVRVMAIAADDRTLWLAGTERGLQFNDDHEAWLMAVDLSNGAALRTWRPEKGVTVEQIVAHPAGDLLLTNGTTGLTLWDKRQEARKTRVPVAGGTRNIKALALTQDGRRIATADLSGWTTLWDWPEDSPPLPLWSRQLAEPAPHLLTFSGNGRRLYAGAVDGSTRVLASADGAEIARLIRFDNDEWITMIPEGYFVASQEGDRWVNVRIDDKVYGIDQFYDVFYRPDIVERKLAGMAIAPLIKVTLRDALRQPPPRVALDIPKADHAAGQRLDVTLRAQDLGGGVGEMRLLHNGKLVEVFNRSGAAGAAPPFETRAGVELAAGENALTLVGFNAAGNLNARPVTSLVQATGTAPEPRVFILAVGIDHFLHTDQVNPLRYAVKDADDFAQAMQKSLGEVYRDAPVTLIALRNADASRAALDAALKRLRREMRATDLLVWFVASHGTLDSEARYGIVLHDWDGQPRESSLFSAADLLESARTLRAFNQLVVLDTCHAGGVNSLVKGLYDARLAVLARNMGLHILASANATEEALDGYQGNGLFTHTLLQGLTQTRADKNADGRISVRELGDYARRETRRIARLLRHSQEPLLMNYGKDVVLRAVEPAPTVAH
ncbi:MAG: caspase family protein [Hydrogenophilales bacterium]|nr:caspase family protein [Hydrogenophilales bacterium]